MRYAIVLAAALGLSFVAGCASYAARSQLAGASGYAPASEVLQDSLFKEDNAVISNEDMARVLDSEIRLPERGKLAVVRFGQLPYWWGWSEDFVRMNQDIDKRFLDRLATSERLKAVAYLPSLVTPQNMSLPYLRQAAGRFQAHLILIYRTTNQNYQRSKVFAADETRAYCTVEAVLLDTRTGIVPFSTVISKDYSAKQTDQDTNFAETIAKANQQAIGRAWVQLADEVVTYMNNLPKPPATQSADSSN